MSNLERATFPPYAATSASIRPRGRRGEYEPLTRFGVAQLVRLLGEEAGLSKRVHPHLISHSFATWALTRGA